MSVESIDGRRLAPKHRRRLPQQPPPMNIYERLGRIVAARNVDDKLGTLGLDWTDEQVRQQVAGLEEIVEILRPLGRHPEHEHAWAVLRETDRALADSARGIAELVGVMRSGGTAGEIEALWQASSEVLSLAGVREAALRTLGLLPPDEEEG